MSDDAVITEKNILKRGQKKPLPLDTRTAAEKEIDAAVARSSLKGRMNIARKKNFRLGIAAGAILLVAYGIYWLFAPVKGSMAYGICKTFLELNIRYPNTLHLSMVEEFGTSVRIWYAHTDSFGEYRYEPIQCYFKADDQLPFVLERITISRREIDPRTIERFNNTLPIIFANPPNLDMPTALPDSLGDLKIDSDQFRKPIFDRPVR